MRFDLGRIDDLPPLPPGMPGRWRCEFPGDRLIWSDGVYDLFGLPRGARGARDEVVRRNTAAVSRWTSSCAPRTAAHAGCG